jgi:aldose 1-epimerase
MPDGTPVWLCELKNGNGLSAEVLTYGATIHRLRVPDRKGKAADVVLGRADLAGYQAPGTPAAAAIGRVANRIRNHTFNLNGRRYTLDANERKTTLHGGSGNYAHKNFALVDATDRLVRLAVRDHGEGGFPGEVAVEVCYSLDDDNALLIEYTAVPTEDTPVNLTNHVYFNLAGQGSGPVDKQILQIAADFYTPADARDIPTGEVAKTRGTPLDFTRPQKLGDALAELAAWGDRHGGFDHNFVLNGCGWRKISTAEDEASGRVMETYTDLPGVQLYTANGIRAGSVGKDGAAYEAHGGFCLETQFFPDTIHKPHFPDCVVAADEVFATSTAYRFLTR